jgi:hypothetical protein
MIGIPNGPIPIHMQYISRKQCRQLEESDTSVMDIQYHRLRGSLGKSLLNEGRTAFPSSANIHVELPSAQGAAGADRTTGGTGLPPPLPPRPQGNLRRVGQATMPHDVSSVCGVSPGSLNCNPY